jgi:hypothetical protein
MSLNPVTPAVARRARTLCLVVLVGSVVAGLLALVLIERLRGTWEDGLEPSWPTLRPGSWPTSRS